MYVRDGEEAVTQIEQLVDKGFYLVRGDPVVSRLEGWKDSMVAAGEAAAGRLAISYVESHFQAQDVCLLTSTGQLRSPNKKVTVGQVDAGAVVKGRLALLVSKKTRLLLDNVSQLYNTIVKIKRFRDKYDSLAEFRGLDLYGALVAEALPDDEDDRSLLLDEVRNYGFGLFERNGVEYSCSIKPGRKYGVCGEERAEF